MEDFKQHELVQLAAGCWREHGRPPRVGQQCEAVLDAAARHPAVLDVLAERVRQVEVEGCTPEHDDEHKDGQLASASASYAVASMRPEGFTVAPSLWPWDLKWWKPTFNRRRMLVKAGALILAEIERLDRDASR